MWLSEAGAITPFGDKDALFHGLLRGERAFTRREIYGKEFSVGEINFALPCLPVQTDELYCTRTNQILLGAILQISKQIDDAIKRYGADRIGVVIGTTTAGVEENYAAFCAPGAGRNFIRQKLFDKSQHKPSGCAKTSQNGQNLVQIGTDVSFDRQTFIKERGALSNPAEFARKFLGLKSIALGVSTACTSGIKAFESAANFIKLGICDAVVVGGVDSLNSLTILGFNSLSVLSNGLCAPFDANRDGINIGEGAAVFVLCKDEISTIKLKSFASSCDAFHITQPDPNATQQIAMIKRLLESSAVKKPEFISAHATGTIANELSEVRAIAQTLPETLTSGIKANIGHTLGACGAIEAAVCAEAILRSVVPMQILHEYDVALEPINIACENVKISVKNCLNLSFAFGGDSAGMVIGV